MLPDGMSEITIRNDDNRRERLIIKKGVAISLMLNDTNNIVQIKARIWTNTI